MKIVVHGIMVPIGMSKKHDDATRLFDRRFARVPRRCQFSLRQEVNYLAINLAYAKGKGSMAKPYYVSFLDHPDGRSLNVLVEARESAARRLDLDAFARASSAHLLDALIDYSLKNDLPVDRLVKSRRRCRVTPGSLFFWGDKLEVQVVDALGLRDIRDRQVAPTTSRHPRGITPCHRPRL